MEPLQLLPIDETLTGIPGQIRFGSNGNKKANPLIQSWKTGASSPDAV